MLPIDARPPARICALGLLFLVVAGCRSGGTPECPPGASAPCPPHSEPAPGPGTDESGISRPPGGGPESPQPPAPPPPDPTDPDPVDPGAGGETPVVPGGPSSPPPPAGLPGAGAGVGPATGLEGFSRRLHVSPSGADTRDGSPGAPLRTIARAVQLARPGDAIVVHAGTYRERLRIESADGTAAAPITLMGAPGERAILKGGDGQTQALIDVRRAHWHVVGLTLDVAGDRAFAAIWRTAGGRHGVLRACEAMNGTAGAGVTVAEGASDVLIADNHIHHFQKPNDDSHGVLVQTTSARVVVRNNDIHHSSGDAVQCLGPEGGATIPGTPFDDLRIEGNLLHDNRENGVDVKTCTRVVIVDNDIHGHVKSPTSRGEAIVIHLSASGVRIEENRLWNNGRAISLGGVRTGAPPSDIVVRRNRVWAGVNASGEDGAGMRVDTVERVQVFHNTFHGMPGFCLAVGSGDSGASRDIEIHNNIFSECALAVKSGAGLERVRMDSNLYFRASGGARFTRNGQTVGLAAWRSGSTFDTGSLEADPRFVAPGAGDFRLAPDSPARQRGISVGEGFCGDRPDLGALESCS